MSRPILVTGSHRSGTTWAGRMLCLSGEAGYIHEPFNPLRKPGWSGGRIPHWYLYVHEGNAAHYEPVVRDVLAFRYPVVSNLRDVRGPKQVALFAQDLARSLRYRATTPRPLIKDPIALFAAPWLSDRFDAQVVVMIRRPAAFVGSIKRLNWRFRFRSWLAQEELLRDLLGPYTDAMHRCWSTDPDIVEQGIVMWNAIHHAIDRYRTAHPGWSFVRHEDISAAPLDGFRDLYGAMGLAWSDAVADEIAAYSSESNPKDVSARRHQSIRRSSRDAVSTWRQRLTEEETDRVRRGTAEVARRFYPEDF